MGEMRKIDVALDEELVGEIDAAVASGEFDTIDAIVVAALDAWKMDRLLQDPENVLRLRRLWEEGIASGPAVEMTDDWFEDVKRRGQAKIDAGRAAQ